MDIPIDAAGLPALADAAIAHLMSEPIRSPCKKICVVDPNQSICVGCFRTLDELGRWTMMSKDDRLAIKAELGGREEAYRAARSG